MDETARKHMLIVEDEEKVAALLKLYFEMEGFDVQAEHSGRAALEEAARRRPDVVILDLRLPDVDGCQVSQELRKLYDRSATAILMLTAMDRAIDRVRGFAHGADAYLPKPFELDEVGETVGVLLGRWDAGGPSTDLGCAAE
jgi:two-component system OmpR family response regulator